MSQSATETADMRAWFGSVELLICVGGGGVGKTTTAAACGLRAALDGRKVMVLTIDPARRLANSLGLSGIGNQAVQIDLGQFQDPPGELWAMMLDSQSAFDNLVTRIAPNSETLERILGNRVYRHVSETFAGNQEYMATEQLYDLVESGKYDLLILDTPPVENALDFLESSGRILRFLDEKILKWFLLPKAGKKGMGRRFFRTTKDVFFHLLGYLFGHEFLEELLEFFQDFTSLYKGFRARHLAVEALFLAKTTHFMTVCAPTSASLSIGGFFQKELGARGLGRAGIVINQMHPSVSESHDAAAHFSNMGDHVDGEVIQLLGVAHEAAYNISQIQSQRVDTALDQYGEFGFLRRVEKRIGNVHNLEALYEVGDGIFGKMVSEK